MGGEGRVQYVVSQYVIVFLHMVSDLKLHMLALNSCLSLLMLNLTYVICLASPPAQCRSGC